MTRESSVEIERKYDVDAVALIPWLVGAGLVAAEAEPLTAELAALYLDTEQLDLAKHQTALRRREGGADEGWHIKMPADEGRIELHWPLSPVEQVPEGIQDAVRDNTAGRPLLPLARVLNTRITTVLLDASGVPIAEVCDDHVRSENLRGGGARAWREWEVELRSGAPDTREERTELLDVIEERMLAAGASPSGSSSKLARALGLPNLN